MDEKCYVSREECDKRHAESQKGIHELEISTEIAKATVENISKSVDDIKRGIWWLIAIIGAGIVGAMLNLIIK